MSIVIIQLICILSLLILVCCIYFNIRGIHKESRVLGKALWELEVRNRSYGTSEKLELSEGTYFLGKGFINDITLKMKGEKVRLYLNVQKDKIYLSVLDGAVRIQNVTHRSNKESQIAIGDYDRICFQDYQLQFKRKKVI